MRRTILAACALAMTGWAAPLSAGALDLPTPVKPLTAAQFGPMGLAAGALPLTIDATVDDVAAALDVDPTAVSTYYTALCGGTAPLLGPKLYPYPSDVFAYAAIFDTVDANCLTTERTLAAERGKVARAMANNQLRLDNLLRPKASKVDRMCETFQGNEKLTTFAVATAAAKLFKLGEAGKKAAELGVSVLIANCQSVFG